MTKLVKLISITSAIFLIVLQQQTCMAVIGIASSVVGLGQFIYEISETLFSKPKTVDETLSIVRSLNSDVRYDLGEIMKILKDLPSIIYATSLNIYLELDVIDIGRVFEKAVEYQREIQNNDPADKKIFEEFSVHGREIDTKMNRIRHIILRNNTLSDLMKNFTTDIQAYQSVCKTGMSHLQLFDNLVGTLKIVTGQYFIARTLIYKFLDFESNPIHDREKRKLTAQIIKEYAEDVEMFKTYMANASREFWSCDLRDYTGDVRYENKPDSPYYELMAFQKYIAKDKSFTGTVIFDGNECNRGAYMSIKDCADVDWDVCGSVRTCGLATKCKKLYDYHNYLLHTPGHYVCMNNDTNAIARYKSIVPTENAFLCEGGIVKSLYPVRNALGWGSIQKFGQEVCDCICLDNVIYLSYKLIIADVTQNKVMTGVKFTKINNTLYLQIQEGQLLANGSINRSTVAWKPVDTVAGRRYSVKITLDTQIDLTTIMLPTDRVITGIGLSKSTDSHNRIRLEVYAKKIDFRSGRLIQNHSQIFLYGNKYVAEYAQQELDLSNSDVSTRSSRPNIPDSNDNQYVKFNITSLEKDGGQTTVPFIDAQKVTPYPPSPLSGVGLLHRGQKGYGGFLSLKVYTYDINPYIEKNINLINDQDTNL